MKIEIGKYISPLYTQKFYEADVWGGRGRGGSHGLTQHAMFSMMSANYFRGYFVRAIHGHIRDSLWQDFKDRIEETSDLNNYNYLNDFSLREDTMSATHIPTGNQIRSKGFKASTKGNTAHMKSIAGATHIYGEEWEEVGQEENNKLMDSLRTIKAPIQIIRSWNAPPKDHWLVKEYFNLFESEIPGYYRLEPKESKGHLSLFGTYKVNIKNLDSNTVARYERYKETSPRYYYNQILGLVSDGGDRKVYYGWKPIPFAEFLNIDGAECYGVDFGDTAPTSVVWLKYVDGRIYRHEVLYESLRSLQQRYKDEILDIREHLTEIEDNQENNIWSKHKGLLTYVFELMGIRKDLPMFCDPAQSGLIIELRLAGYQAVKAVKEKAANINFINRADNYYTAESINMEHEYNHYYLEEDINKQPIDGKPKKGQDHCFVKDTIINTINGNKRIKDVKAGDFVLTSLGYSRVLIKWNNGKKETVKYRILFDTFLVYLHCTPNHLIKTNKGWIEISKLESGMMVSHIKHLTEEGLNFIQMKDTSAVENTECTSLYGNTLMDQLQKASTSIISMVIHGIIELKILNVLTATNTFLNTASVGLKKTLNGLNLFNRKELKQQQKAIGGKPKKVKEYVKKTVKDYIKTRYINHTSAISVGIHTKVKSQTETDFVHLSVNQNGAETQELMTKKETVKCAQLNLQSTSMLKQNAVQESVLISIEELNKSNEYVYDLTVENEHEYFANGINVHNCMESAEYGARGLKDLYNIRL